MGQAFYIRSLIGASCSPSITSSNPRACNGRYQSAMAAPGPTLTTWALQQVGRYLRYTGHHANVVAKAARDPDCAKTPTLYCIQISPQLRSRESFDIHRNGTTNKKIPSTSRQNAFLRPRPLWKWRPTGQKGLTEVCSRQDRSHPASTREAYVGKRPNQIQQGRARNMVLPHLAQFSNR